MTNSTFQERLFPKTVKSLEKKLARLYKIELQKLLSSVKKSCEKGISAGITQTIGRRFGYFWEEMVKDVFENKFKKCNRRGLEIDISALVLETIEDIITKNSGLKKERNEAIMQDIRDRLEDILETGVLGIADFTYETEEGKKRGLEIKWRIRWNDAKTVKSHCLAAHRLKSRGFEPIMLIRRPKEESFSSPIERFEREGWKVLTAKETMDFITKETGFNLENWIRANVDFWKELSPYKECLEAFTLTSHDFEF